MEIIVEKPKRYAKPEGFCGRGKGNCNYKKYKWDIVFFDKEQGTIKGGKYSTIKELNADLGLNLNTDLVWRLTTGHRVDTKKRNGENSFLSRWGHIKLTKIDEIKIIT